MAFYFFRLVFGKTTFVARSFSPPFPPIFESELFSSELEKFTDSSPLLFLFVVVGETVKNKKKRGGGGGEAKKCSFV